MTTISRPVNLPFQTAGSFFTPVTQGLTLTNLWDDPDVDYDDLSDVQSLSALASVYLTPQTEGFIFESGGAAWGSGLYAYQGVLYWQCGRGNFVGNNLVTTELSIELLPAGNYIIEVVGDRLGVSKLYINGQLLRERIGGWESPVRLTGADIGGIARAHGGVIDNRGNFPPNGGILTNGSVDFVNAYANQTV